MVIKIIPEQDIYLTQSEYDRYLQEYSKSCMMMAYPPSFEDWVKQRLRNTTKTITMDSLRQTRVE